MAETRAENFIERLPPIIEREEVDISHLDEQMVEILYPERAPKDFTLSIVFGPPRVQESVGDAERGEITAAYARAVTLAESSPSYRREGSDRTQRHVATFSLEQVQELHELFSLVGDYETCEILVKGKRVPYARELWLPLFWFFIEG